MSWRTGWEKSRHPGRPLRGVNDQKLVPFLFQLWRTSDPNLPGCTPEAWHQGLLCPGVATCSRLTPFPISTWNCKKVNLAWLPSYPDGPKDDAQAQGPRHWAALRFVGFHS